MYNRRHHADVEKSIRYRCSYVGNLQSSWFDMVAKEGPTGLCKTFIHSINFVTATNVTEHKKFSLISYEVHEDVRFSRSFT